VKGLCLIKVALFGKGRFAGVRGVAGVVGVDVMDLAGIPTT